MFSVSLHVRSAIAIVCLLGLVLASAFAVSRFGDLDCGKNPLALSEYLIEERPFAHVGGVERSTVHPDSRRSYLCEGWSTVLPSSLEGEPELGMIFVDRLALARDWGSDLDNYLDEDISWAKSPGFPNEWTGSATGSELWWLVRHDGCLVMLQRWTQKPTQTEADELRDLLASASVAVCESGGEER